MSSLFLTSYQDAVRDAAARQLKFTEYTQEQRISWDSLNGVIARVDRMELWGPAADEHSGVCAALGGRVAFDRYLWEEAERLPYSGSLSCRLIIRKWLQDPDNLATWLNGAFCVAIYDRHAGELHVFTDRMGIFPIYVAEHPGILLCSHPDVLADTLDLAGLRNEPDLTTMAEFLATGTGTHPYTYYASVRQLDPASHYIWRINEELSRFSGKTYWRPAFLSAPAEGLDERRAQPLAEAFTSA
ncbi:MAG: hypothetical protein D3906_17060, partial [Candidatus Electrothrix sp. AUS1_2]|nr:hypothetical protein [Candidatus Electrothrix sp. AUS1_2]